MLNIINKPYYKAGENASFVNKKTYTKKTIDIRSTVIDFASSKGNHIISRENDKKNTLQRIL